jgi:hypothetical protein
LLLDYCKNVRFSRQDWKSTIRTRKPSSYKHTSGNLSSFVTYLISKTATVTLRFVARERRYTVQFVPYYVLTTEKFPILIGHANICRISLQAKPILGEDILSSTYIKRYIRKIRTKIKFSLQFCV